MIFVLMPGMDGTGDLFRSFNQALPSECEAIVLRYPSHRLLSYHELFDLIRSQLPTTPFVLVAESFSSPLAVQMSVSAPEALHGLVLVSAFVLSPYFGWRRALIRQIPESLFKLRLPRWINRMFLSDLSVSSLVVDEIGSAIASVEGAVLRHRLHEVLNVDAREALRRIGVPVLCLFPDRDRLLFNASRRIIDQIRPDVDSVSLTGPHLLLQTRPVEAVAAIVQWLPNCVR